MKKLGKSTLEELAKRIPVLSDKEQQASIGGYRYYDVSGQFIEQIGSSNEIRFIDRCYFESIIMNDSSESLISQSSSFRDGSQLAREGAVRQIATGLGISIQPFYDRNNGLNGRCKGGSCMINMNSKRVNDGNFYDIALIAIHEKNHLDTPHDTGTFHSEAEAYDAMMSHPYYFYASPDYRTHIADKYQEYSNK